MVIQELKPSSRVQGRWLAVMDDGSILRVSESEVISFTLYAGKELGAEEIEQLQIAANRNGLKEKALSLLARKPQSRREMERKLGQWEASEQEAEAICDRLEELGYLNDAAYAVQIVRHYSGKGYGERKIRDELYRRGIPREMWEEALEQCEDSMQAIDAFLEKKLSGRVPDPKELKRVSDALIRRGYCWSDINERLRHYGIETGD